jgi:hypothetical protein
MLTKKQKNGKWILSRTIEFFVIDSDEVKETILDFILYKEIDIDDGKLQKNFFQGLFHPSLTKKFANNLTFPFWRFLWRNR